MELSERIYAGNRAKEVLENEVFVQAMADIKAEIISKWEQSPARDCEAREKLWIMLKLSEKLESFLKTTLESGKLAQLDLVHKQTVREKLQSMIG